MLYFKLSQEFLNIQDQHINETIMVRDSFKEETQMVHKDVKKKKKSSVFGHYRNSNDNFIEAS